jgi:hypothetical protein
MTPSRVLLILLRALAGIQVVVGIGFWTGHWSGAVPYHRAFGVLFVLVLWAIASIALAGRRNVGLAIGAIVWGMLIAGLGMSQQRILIGDLHWIVRVTHLAISLAAMPLAERLVASRRRTA